MPNLISPSHFVAAVLGKVRTPAIPYMLGGRSPKGTDCINLIGWCMDELKGKSVPRGANEAWNKSMTWRGTLDEARKQGKLVMGALVYIKGAQTAKGRMGHVGVYTGDQGLKTPDGKASDVVHASASRGGVYPSTIKNGWTHVAWLDGVDYGGSVSSDPEPPAPHVTEPGPGQAKVITTMSGLYLRKLPSKDGARIKEMPIGTIVDVLDFKGPWVQVRWDVSKSLYHIGWCCAKENGVPYLQFG